MVGGYTDCYAHRSVTTIETKRKKVAALATRSPISESLYSKGAVTLGVTAGFVIGSLVLLVIFNGSFTTDRKLNLLVIVVVVGFAGLILGNGLLLLARVKRDDQRET